MDVKGIETINLVSIVHLVDVPHLVSITHPCPHLVGITHPCMTTPWRKQVRQQMRCVWTLVMTWAPWHTMMRVHPIRLPIVCCLLFYTSQFSLMCLINFGLFQHSPSENQPSKFVPEEFSLSSPSSLQNLSIIGSNGISSTVSFFVF